MKLPASHLSPIITSFFNAMHPFQHFQIEKGVNTLHKGLIEEPWWYIVHLIGQWYFAGDTDFWLKRWIRIVTTNQSCRMSEGRMMVTNDIQIAGNTMNANHGVLTTRYTYDHRGPSTNINECRKGITKTRIKVHLIFDNLICPSKCSFANLIFRIQSIGRRTIFAASIEMAIHIF